MLNEIKLEKCGEKLKAVILAGGFGKRLECINQNTTPKPMTLICGKPVLEHQIEALKKEGINEFILVIGYLSDKIEEYFGDGSSFGVSITYFRETKPLGTAGALFRLKLTEDFLLCNGDLIFDFSVRKMVSFHHGSNALATLFTHPNNHPYDSTLVCTDEKDRVRGFITGNEKLKSYQNLCNAGIQIISPDLLKLCPITGAANLDRDIIMPCVKTGRIYSYKSAEYVRDMGTPERLETVEADLKKGNVKARHSDRMQKAVFLDRDGTINKFKGYITNPDEIELIDGAAEAISEFSRMGYLVIVITNQPVIARGECSKQALKEIHNRLETLLGEKGAYVDEIYYCPHHPDKGFEGEIEELKIQCNCRKPSPGLLLRAQKDFNIDMSESFMVGDSLCDAQSGENAGCIPVLLTSEPKDATSSKYLSFGTLYEFSEFLSKK